LLLPISHAYSILLYYPTRRSSELDILLGGNWEVEVASLENPTPEQIAQIKADWQKRHQQVLESGGLQVIASERHESRRIDNQLRSEEHTSELQSRENLVCRLLLEK